MTDPTDLIPRELAEQSNRANVARIELLVTDAEQKKEEYASGESRGSREMTSYYGGFIDGLRRALRVLEGKG